MDCKCHKVCRQMRSFFAGRSWMTVYCLMVTVRTSPISCQLQLDKATFLDNPQADLFCTSSTRTSHKYSREKNVADHFAQAFTLPPRKYKTRLERTLFSRPTPKKDNVRDGSIFSLRSWSILLLRLDKFSRLIRRIANTWVLVGERQTLRSLVRYSKHFPAIVDLSTPNGLSH